MSGSIWDWHSLFSPATLGLGPADSAAAGSMVATPTVDATTPTGGTETIPVPPVPTVGTSASPDQPAVPQGQGLPATPSSQTLVQALAKLSEQANKQNAQAQPPQNIRLNMAPYNTSSAGFNRGGGESLSGLIQALQQRYAGLMQPGASRSQGGLLG